MSYFEDLYETFIEQPIKILCTAFLIWALFPVLIFAIGGIFLLIKIITLENFTNLFVNAIIPWWASIRMNFKQFILEYFIIAIITLILVHHDILETIDFNGLIQRLRNL